MWERAREIERVCVCEGERVRERVCEKEREILKRYITKFDFSA